MAEHDDLLDWQAQLNRRVAAVLADLDQMMPGFLAQETHAGECWRVHAGCLAACTRRWGDWDDLRLSDPYPDCGWGRLVHLTDAEAEDGAEPGWDREAIEYLIQVARSDAVSDDPKAEREDLAQQLEALLADRDRLSVDAEDRKSVV